MKLRSYQQELVDITLSPKKSNLNVIIQADTGSGKTAVLAEIAKKSTFVLCVAHRNILIRQFSSVLAKFNVKHDVISTKYTKRQCILEHRGKGESVLTSKANKYVCSIDSLLSRYRRNILTLDTKKEWVIIVDEAHHMVSKNKWGKLTEIFPNARVIGATATPCRLDGKSLSRKKDGVFDELIQASTLKENSLSELIDMGFISPFKCYSLPEHIETGRLTKTNADYTYKSLCTETNKVKYKMAGDAVKYYKKLAKNKQALVFCVSIDIAIETAGYFKKNGVPAAAIHSKLTQVEVTRIFNLFEQKEIKVLCNVDIIGEGVDIPAIEALIMLRKTASFGLYRQWIGRSLRPEKGKEYAILLDHVANIREHGFPDKDINWNLECPPVASKSNLFPCPKCRFLNLAWARRCGECEKKLIFDARSATENNIEYVDLQLVETHRRKGCNEKKQLQIEMQHKNEINQKSLKVLSEYGIVGKLSTVLRELAIEHLQTVISVSECNDFLLATEDKNFWISNFSSVDTKKPNHEKIQKVYKRWRQSK